MLRDREPLLRDREPVLREDFAAPPVDLRVADVRLVPPLEDFARDDPAFFAPDVERVPLFRAPLVRELLAADVLERFAVERFAVERLAVERLRVVDLRAPVERPELEAAVAPPPSPESHFPVITRCAASATASAISSPSFVALDITLVAACEAVSAASRPASRILRRTAGLAASAAAAAVKPAASISLLIAALASLSTVLLFDLDDDFDAPLERDLDVPVAFFEDDLELFLADFAIAYSPSVGKIDTQRP